MSSRRCTIVALLLAPALLTRTTLADAQVRWGSLEYHARSLQAFGETVGTSPAGAVEYVRLLTLPSFEPRSLIRVERRPYGIFLAIRRAAGTCCGRPLLTAFELLVQLPPEAWDSVTVAIEQLGMCGSPNVDPNVGIDGVGYYFDGVVRGHECRAAFWSPDPRGDPAAGARQDLVNLFDGMAQRFLRAN
jgi:hypothetical protein